MYKIINRDCLDWLKKQPDDSVDLIFTSPPYEDCRTYGIDFKLQGQKWIDWCFERYIECNRICKGLVAWVVEGKTRKFQWSATPVLLMSQLHIAGIKLRKPPAYYRVGIPGSGGPDWLRNDYEFIVCSSKGKLPWSDNTAMGSPCKYGPGGVLSHRLQDGTRINLKKMEQLVKQGISQREAARQTGVPFKTSTSGIKNSKTNTVKTYIPPKKANPGNVIKCVVGGGKMGSKYAHKNEAPFPESLCEFFIKSFCPPNGIVLDIFAGSFSTIAAAIQCGRKSIGIEIRKNQCDIGKQRLKDYRK